ncbi:MAG: hypothetical protein K0Q79_2902 [Flavipsychrobacter sp.]|jgi:hemoglobin/transferrin/lactoferrin receptor protein|nr:hypothetical protein [Flavipsychrobacter sp.]
MKLIRYIIFALFLTQTHSSFAQPDTSKTSVGLDEFIFSANKTEESKKSVAQQVIVLDKKQIAIANAQNTADLLSYTGNVFVQKSQAGGGSPVLRGFEASRILLVVDGVRMNTIIYRSGHLQNILTMDNNTLDRAEILFGPSSTVYGSDALGGVIHFYTRKPVFATGSNKVAKSANAFYRYSSVNNEMTGHADFSIGGERLASVTSVTYSMFDDLIGGASQNPFYDTSYGERPFYVKRINGKDSLVKNANKYKQVYSGYSQYDIMQKLAFKQNEHVTHGLNLQYSNSTDIPRYDRLTDPKGTGLNSAEWYYGPQMRMLAAYDLNVTNETSLFPKIHAGVNYQNIEESRHNRNFGSTTLNHRVENVSVAGLNIDGQRVAGKHNIRVGIDGQYNMLRSTAEKENISTGTTSKLDSRYPDGDNTMANMAIYGSHTMKINDKFTLNDGLRLGYISLRSTFVDTSILHLPFMEANQDNFVYSGSLGLIHTPTDKWKFSLLVSTGYRAPNVDDLAKIFESAPGTLIVPNKGLKPEKTLNTELGISKVFGKSTVWENALFYTQFYDAIVTDKFQFNGMDSVVFNGGKSGVFANQNKKTAYLYGFSSNIRSMATNNLTVMFAFNYTYGRINTDSAAYPLDHIPPMMLRLQLTYTWKKLMADFFINYNGEKNIKDYFMGGEDNNQYATKDGMPAWYTLNLRASYKVHKLVTLQAGIDNIMDTQYRVFASGINAPGRNIFGAVRFRYE